MTDTTSDDDSPESALMEMVMDGLAEFYSRQLSVNIQRGMAYNAEYARYNRHKVFCYDVDAEKRYVPDPKTALLVLNRRPGSRREALVDDDGAPRY